MYFDQTFVARDLAIIALLIVLEGVLSIDNALVLGLLAKRLPKREQARALTYGLVGAFAFRFLAIATAQLLLKYWIVKLLGGLYLFWVAIKYFWDAFRERGSVDEADHTGDVKTIEQVESAFQDEGANAVGENGVAATARSNPYESPKTEEIPPAPIEKRKAGFWSTVIVIELTDIAFAVDSILAAIALVGSPPPGHTGWHPKLWVVVTGGMLGVVLMRYAAAVFIKLLEKFPRFETAAYLLVMVIGGKLVLDWKFNSPEHHALDFHSPKHPAFWAFWILMIISFCIGFIPKKGEKAASSHAA